MADKHVFVIHSVITEIVSEEVVFLNKINLDDVTILTLRKYRPYGKWLHVKPLPNYYQEDFPAGKNIFVSLARLIKLDLVLFSLVGLNHFHLYLPQSGFRFFQILKTNPLCSGYSFIEEGLASYLDRKELNNWWGHRKASTRDKAHYLGRIKDYDFFDGDYEKCYGLFDNAFPSWSRRLIAKYENALKIRQSPLYNLPDNATILIFDSVSAIGHVSFEEMQGAIELLVEYLKDNSNLHVYYKYHPEQITCGEVELWETYFAELRNSLNNTRLPDNLPLEKYFFSNSTYQVYVNMSSLGFYASKLGQKVWSYADYLGAFNEKFKENIALRPSFYWTNIERLSCESKSY